MKGAVLILGASSALGRGVAEAFALRGHPLILGVRDLEEGKRLAADLVLRFEVASKALRFEAGATEEHAALLAAAKVQAEHWQTELAGVVLAFGWMGDEAAAESDAALALRILQINLSGAVSLLTHAAALQKARGEGFLVVIGSVAGDRGRRNNTLYATAKGGLEIFTQGLRAKLVGEGVQVLLVKPGFVDSRMTFGKEGLFAVAGPGRVGESIVRALERGEDVVYVPRFWRVIMTLLRHIPEGIFKHLDL